MAKWNLSKQQTDISMIKPKFTILVILFITGLTGSFAQAIDADKNISDALATIDESLATIENTLSSSKLSPEHSKILEDSKAKLIEARKNMLETYAKSKSMPIAVYSNNLVTSGSYSCSGTSSFVATGASDDNIGSIEELFNRAYSTPDSEAQTKLSLYMQVVEADAGNKEGYQVVAYNNIGSLYEDLGDLKNARVYYEKSLQIQPSYELAKKNLKRIKSQQRTERWNNFANALGQVANTLGNGNVVQDGSSYDNGAIQNDVSYSGGETQTKSRAARNCTHCAGTGECKTCLGRGRILGKIDQEWHPCPSCNPDGKASKEKKGKCTFCKGTGTK